MRLMMFVKANEASEAGDLPGEKELVDMGELIEDMNKAGVLLAAEGLTPSSKGKRLSIKDGKVVKVTDGPFAETKELVGGFCMIQVDSWDDALAWSDRFAAVVGDAETEIRPLHEVEDFPDFPPEAAAREQELRDELQRKASSTR